MLYFHLFFHYWHSHWLLPVTLVDLLLFSLFLLVINKVYGPGSRTLYEAQSHVPVNDDSAEEHRVIISADS